MQVPPCCRSGDLDDILLRDQRELDHEIVPTTSETLSDIRGHGFSQQSTLPPEPHPENLTLDWDAFDIARRVPFPALV